MKSKLDKLACGCHDGACNLYALIAAFGEAIKEVSPMELQSHPATKVILGHLNSLVGQGCYSWGDSEKFFEHLKAQEVAA